MNSFKGLNGLKRHVLVVDDEMINRELLSNILCVEYEVHLAENGKAALDILKAGDCSFSLILLDLLMPVMDGFDLIK